MTPAQKDRIVRAVRKAAREARRDALEASVHRVIAAYIANRGGKVCVSGPIEIQRWPSEGKYKYRVAIRCAGRPPKSSAAAKGKKESAK